MCNRTPENLREAMCEGLRLACEDIMQHAESIVGDMDLMQSLDVTISFDPAENMIIPRITIDREHIGLVNREDVQKLFDIWNGEA